MPADDFREAFAISRPPARLTQDVYDLDPDAFVAAAARFAHDGETSPGVLENFFSDMKHVRAVDRDSLRYAVWMGLVEWSSALRSLRRDFFVSTFSGFLASQHTLAVTSVGPDAWNRCMSIVADQLARAAMRPVSVCDRTLDWLPFFVTMAGVDERCVDPVLRSLSAPEAIGTARSWLAYVCRVAYPGGECPFFSQPYTGAEVWTWLTEEPAPLWSERATQLLETRLRVDDIRTFMTATPRLFAEDAQQDLVTLVSSDFLGHQWKVFARRVPILLRNLSSPGEAYWWDELR